MIDCKQKFEIRVGTARTADVIVYDNTTDGIDFKTATAIATKAAYDPIYWSDDRMCHWMFDFKCEGHWCAGLFHNNGLPDDADEFNPLHVNVYE